MRFGITIPNFGPFFDIRLAARAAALAEQAGWDGFFCWDHVYFGLFPVADPWMLLTAATLATERVRLGPLVTPLPRRRPVKVAREAMTLEHLSRGRLIMGVGIGAMPWEWEQLGEEANMRVRGAMLDESLEVLEKIWSGRPVTHHGAHYTVHVRDLPGWAGAGHFLPGPLHGHIPIWVAGVWPHRAPFRRAAHFDGVVPLREGLELGGRMTPEDIREITAYVRRQRQAALPFEVVIGGHSETGESLLPYAEAGATWWLEAIDPFAFGWDWQGEWPLEAMLERVRQGPPHAA